MTMSYLIFLSELEIFKIPPGTPPCNIWCEYNINISPSILATRYVNVVAVMVIVLTFPSLFLAFSSSPLVMLASPPFPSLLSLINCNCMQCFIRGGSLFIKILDLVELSLFYIVTINVWILKIIV